MAKKTVRKKTAKNFEQFEKRKKDHITFALDDRTQVQSLSGLDSVRLRVDALPDLDIDEISLEAQSFGRSFSSPLFVSSMTAGHGESAEINRSWAHLSCEKNILVAVGSQRRELDDDLASKEWKKILKEFPKAQLVGNLGIAQLISYGIKPVLKLIENLECVAFYIHLNALQEALQPEGTPQFRGGHAILEKLVKASPVPILIKEVGCGLSIDNIERFAEMGISAIDLAGLGGTHWGRVEGLRSKAGSPLAETAEVFKNWGISSVESLQAAGQKHVNCQLFASGGIRSGLDAAKMIALGASMVGLAQPFMKAWAAGAKNGRSSEEVFQLFEKLQYELRTALFCTGSANLFELRGRYDVVKGFVE